MRALAESTVRWVLAMEKPDSDVKARMGKGDSNVAAYETTIYLFEVVPIFPCSVSGPKGVSSEGKRKLMGERDTVLTGPQAGPPCIRFHLLPLPVLSLTSLNRPPLS